VKIELVTETFAPEVNGVAHTLEHLAREWCAHGHRVTVTCPARPERAASPTQPFALREVPGRRLPRYPELRLGWPAGRRLRAAWRDDPPDLVHVATEGPLGWSATRAAQSVGLPLVTSFHTHFESYGRHYGAGFLRPIIYRWLRAHHRRADLVFAPSPELAQRLAADGFGRVESWGRGVDTALFHPGRRDPELRRSWGATADTPVFVVVGRLAPEKNLDLAAQAWRAARAVQPEARLVWVGDGPARAALARAYPETVFVGVKRGEALARHYASADVFLFPSLTETFGNVTLEALASGLVVQAFRYAAAARYVQDGVQGRTIPTETPERWSETAVDLVRRRAEWPEMRAAARRAALDLSWSSVASAYERSVAPLLRPTANRSFRREPLAL
jgi:glycosyltransferase involved in cell wall biosynthesis